MTISATTRGLRPGVCTSTTRPGSPFDGQLIYETDTNRVAVYDTNTWVYKTPASTTGSVLQVVSTTKTDIFSASTASGAITDVTGLDVSITPSSTSSKILVLATVNGFYDVGANRFGVSIALKRGTTLIGGGTAAGNRVSISSSTMAPGLTDNQASANASIMYLDSPSTTSATTYKISAHNPYNATYTIYVNRIGADSDLDDIGRTSSSITVMEIAG